MSNWKAFKEKYSSGGVTPLDLFNPAAEKSSEEVANKRYETCLVCPELIQLTKQCKKCGCFMAAKTKLAAATCPLNKWEA